MPRSKQNEEWITGKEAAQILSERSDHLVKQPYVRYIAIVARKVRYKQVDGRTNLYLRSDIEKIKVEERSRKPKNFAGPAISILKDS